jgi:hypothetical protein
MERLLAIVRLDKLTIKPVPLRPWLEECVNRFRHESNAAQTQVIVMGGPPA